MVDPKFIRARIDDSTLFESIDVGTVGPEVRIVQGLDVIVLSFSQARQLRDELVTLLGEADHG